MLPIAKIKAVIAIAIHMDGTVALRYGDRQGPVGDPRLPRFGVGGGE